MLPDEILDMKQELLVFMDELQRYAVAKMDETLSTLSLGYWKVAARLLLKHPIEEAKHDRKVAEGKATFATSTSPPSSAGAHVLGRKRIDDE